MLASSIPRRKFLHPRYAIRNIEERTCRCSDSWIPAFLTYLGALPVRLGLITDIHERVLDLKLALAAFDRHGVDRVICLGDVFETGAAIRETVALLAERHIAGVWGN
jgi:hypothetical protein